MSGMNTEVENHIILRAQREMCTFDLLRVALAHSMSRGGQVPFIDTGPIGIKMHSAKRLEQLLQSHTYGIGATAKRVRHDHASHMINRVPEPPVLHFAPHNTPHSLYFRGFHATHFDCDGVRTPAFPHAGVDLRESDRLFLLP